MLRTAAQYVAAVALLGGCQSYTKPEDLHATWAMAPKRLPAHATRDGQAVYEYTTPDYGAWLEKVTSGVLKPGIKLPAVLYLHGCAGLTSASTWGGHFTRRGFAFFAPNSYARVGRSNSCLRGAADSKIAMRQAELRYALEKMRQIAWIDPRRLVLVGFSEGGFTAAQYRGTEFAAVVLLGVDCRLTGGSPLTPASVPVLNIVGAQDDWGFGRGCSMNRTSDGSKTVVLQDAGHAVEGDARAFDALDEFLRASVGLD